MEAAALVTDAPTEPMAEVRDAKSEVAPPRMDEAADPAPPRREETSWPCALATPAATMVVAMMEKRMMIMFGLRIGGEKWSRVE